jgi:outer membrane protein assembly factor BamB
MHVIAWCAAAWAVAASCAPSSGAAVGGAGARPGPGAEPAAAAVAKSGSARPAAAPKPGPAGGSGGWLLHRGTPRRTGRADVRGPRRAALQWAFATGGRITADAAVTADGGTIYVASHDGKLYALAADGTRRWAFEAGGKIWSAPAIGPDGAVFFGSDSDRLFAVDADGGERWRLGTAKAAAKGEKPPFKGDKVEDGRWDVDTSPALLADGAVVFGCHADVIAARPDTGAVAWSSDAGGGTAKVFASPALGRDDTIYVGTQADRLVAIDRRGARLWAVATGGDDDATPAVGDDDAIVFGSDDGSVRAVAPGGAVKWRTPLGGPIRAPIAIGPDGTVYASTYGEEPFIAALDGATGVERWRFRTAPGEGAFYGIQSGALVDADGYVYFGGRDRFVYCLSPAGELVWRFETGDQVDASPAIGPDGTLYVGSDDGRLYAFGR